ncbi:MAG: hypothetical protein ACYTGB_20185 [Planctomycetota bacterium]|jgi:NADH dehydrogenase/NADH:ubiquinone oxidoreductase subunit G
MAYELLRMPGRLGEPEIGEQPVRWPETLSRLADEVERLPAGSVGLVLAADASAEEAAQAGEFVEKGLGGAPAAVAFGAGEAAVLAEAAGQPAVPEAALAGLGEVNVVLSVGDVFGLCPVISRKVLDARYGGRGNGLVYFGPEDGLTGRMATARVLESERKDAAAVLKELTAGGGGSADVKAAADLLAKAEPGVAGAVGAAAVLAGAEKVAVVAGTADPVAVRLAKLIAAALGAKASFACLTEAACAADILGAWKPATDLKGVAEAVKSGKLKGLISLGADLVGAGALAEDDLRKLSVVAAASPFASGTTAAAKYVLPAALWAEKSGTMAGKSREAALPAPAGARSYGWILTGLARELSVDLEGKASGGLAEAMALGEAVRLALEEKGPEAPWTAREPSDALLRSAMADVYVA